MQNTCKVKILKKLLRQNIMRQKPSINTIQLIYCCRWGLPLSMICISSKVPLEKAKFYIESTYQLEIGSGLGMGSHVFWTYAGPVCGAYCHSLCEFIRASVLWCREDPFFSLVFSILSDSYNLLRPLHRVL